MSTQGPGEPRAAVSLRPYQEAAITAAGEMIARKRADGQPPRALIVLPTGCGKTQTAITLLERALRKRPDARVLWLAHRSELLDQPIRAMARIEGTRWLAQKCGVVQGDRSQPDRQIVMASIATLASRRGKRAEGVLQYGVPRIIVIDEAHHSTSGQYEAVLREVASTCSLLGEDEPLWIGLTATPERTDGVGLARLWGTEPAFTYQISDAIRDGYLCPPRFVDAQLQIPDDLQQEIDRLEAAGLDEEMGDLLITAGIVPATVDAMAEHLSRGEQTGAPVPSLVFCASKKQAGLTCEALVKAGWRAALLTGDTKTRDRRIMLTDYEHGNIDVIVNVAVLTEGTDLPRCGGIVAARPFSSKPLWMQSVGRGLRLYPEKAVCLVVDLAGAHKEHNGILGVALIGEDDADAATNRTPAGISYEVCGDEIELYGTVYAGKVDGPDGPEPILVRALPVTRGKARGVLPPGVDRGLPLIPVAIGVRVRKEDGAPPKIEWTPIREATPGQTVDEIGVEPALLPVSGRELRRVVGTSSASNLTRERRPLRVAWVVATIAGREVRVVELGADLPQGRSRTPIALWVVEDGHADGEPGYRLIVRDQGKRTLQWYSVDQLYRQITSAPVPWASAEALCSDYVRQAARTAAADEDWRSEPADPVKMQRVILGFGLPSHFVSAVRTAGDLYDLRAKLFAERDPVGGAILDDLLGAL